MQCGKCGGEDHHVTIGNDGAIAWCLDCKWPQMITQYRPGTACNYRAAVLEIKGVDNA